MNVNALLTGILKAVLGFFVDILLGGITALAEDIFSGPHGPENTD